jgi:hypothetical protein
MKLENFLKKHKACENLLNFAKDLTLEEFLTTCENGEWILWLFTKVNYDSLQEIEFIEKNNDNIAKNLIKVERSLKLANVAINFEKGKASEEDLKKAVAAFSFASAYAAFESEDQKINTNICREHLPIKIWNQNKLF